jgi:hypothetical protein
VSVLHVTTAFAVWFTEPDVAVIVAVPSPTEVTSPALDTVAKLVFEVAHVTVAPEIALAFASLTVAVSWAVSPGEVRLTLADESPTLDATWLTVAVAVLFTEPDVAVIVAVPSATEVTRPADDTVATDELDVAHVTVGLGIVTPSASVTVGTNVAVSPIDESARLVGDSVTLDATWLTVTEADPLAEPDVAVIVAVPLATAVTSPADETVAMDVL